MQRYNPKANAYQRWSFDSNGGVANWQGRWNKKKRTMIWNLNLEGYTGVMRERFVNKDKYASTILIINNDGQVLLKGKVMNTRVTSKK